MPLKQVLHDLTASVRGSLGAMFLDQEGETVAVTDGSLPAYDLQVIGAYSGIFLSNAIRLCDSLTLGAAQRLKIGCQNSTLLISSLNDGYYLVLVISTNSPEAVAWREIMRTRERLNEEI